MDVKIGDFGLTKEVAGVLPSVPPTAADGASSGVAGTFLYLAPELLVNGKPNPATPAVDIFALGIVLLEIWFNFGTTAERVVMLETLRKTGKVPAEMTTHKPLNTKTLLEINTLIEQMVCPPEERISLNDLVQALPSANCSECRRYFGDEVVDVKQQRSELEQALGRERAQACDSYR